MGLRVYEVEPSYIDYLCASEPKMFHNAKSSQFHSRKYVGIVLEVDGFDYMVPLSSYKPKHAKMKKNADIVFLEDLAVLNMNKMFPVPRSEYKLFCFNTIKDWKYLDLIHEEQKLISKLQEKILKKARFIYYHKLNNGDSTALGRRCNDFKKLETLCEGFNS